MSLPGVRIPIPPLSDFQKKWKSRIIPKRPASIKLQRALLFSDILSKASKNAEKRNSTERKSRAPKKGGEQGFPHLNPSMGL